MEYHLTKKNISQPRDTLDTVSEQAVDMDITLPDYCPDIERILSCTLIPKIYMANVSADRLNIEGGSCVRILYLDGEQGCIRSYEYSQPFSESLPLKSPAADCAVYTDTKPEYINCRALSPRKLSLHGAFSLYAKITEPCELDYYTCKDEGDLQVRGEKTEACALSGVCTENISVQEDIPLSGKDVGSILSHRLTARITELKAIHNKMMLSAELKLELLYLSGADRKEAACMSYSLPLSRVIDCEGAEEDAVIDGELSVMSYDIRLSDDALDGSSLLSLDAKLCFCAQCYEEKEIEVMCDAFSTDRDVEMRIQPFSCRGKTLCRSYTDIGKAEIRLDEEIGKVLDVHCEKIAASCVTADGMLMVRAKLCVGILFENTEGETRYAERDAEFVYKPDTEGCDEVVRLKAAVDSLSYRLTDSRRIELRAELCYRLTLCRRVSCSAVTAVSADDDAPEREKDGSLILYYTDKGDNVWDISKRFRSRPADIIAENGLDGGDVASGVMLLIPSA
ncbi:MAG: DUF3794 domain-containing protein [Ruminococcus sp.]|nr:DUF3794 domain-containing protein [Ruminococcus sp.]